MKLYEYMAKEILARYGVPTPPGGVACSPSEAAALAGQTGPVALKAQVLAGGRGKAGGIRFAETPVGAAAAAGELLGKQIGGYTVERLLVEKKLSIDREFYLSIAIDAGRRCPVLMFSTRGGVDIEEVPERDIFKRPVDAAWGLQPYLVREVASRAGVTGSLAGGLAEVAVCMYRAFTGCDAELVEINPLVVADGKLVAADARLNVDDDAVYRHPDLPRVEEGTSLERQVRQWGLSYVELDGDIAVMANGAGITMATIDILASYGGRAANFLDAGGGAGVEPTAKAIAALIATRPRAILINIFGGITRCDDVARAIVRVKEEQGIPVPVVVRLAGTNEAEGVRILREAGMMAYRDLSEAASRVVHLAGQNGGGADARSGR